MRLMDAELANSRTDRLKSQGWIGFGFKSLNGFSGDVMLITGDPNHVRREIKCKLGDIYPALVALEFDYEWEKAGNPPINPFMGGTNRGSYV
jgi:hypothetical protein